MVVGATGGMLTIAAFAFFGARAGLSVAAGAATRTQAARL